MWSQRRAIPGGAVSGSFPVTAPAIVDVTEAMIRATLRSALLLICPTGTDIIRAQVNRVPEPKQQDFIVITSLWRRRLATNYDVTEDVIAAATVDIAGNMNVTTVQGVLLLGAAVIWPGIVPGTVITGQLTGLPGAAGLYSVSPAPGAAIGPGPVYAGLLHASASTEVVFQLDIHGPQSPESAQMIATLLRDEWATDYFKTAFPERTVQPLYVDDPRQTAFVDAEAQYEDRWTVDVHLQANPTISVLQQFAATVQVGLVPVDEFFDVV